MTDESITPNIWFGEFKNISIWKAVEKLQGDLDCTQQLHEEGGGEIILCYNSRF